MHKDYIQNIPEVERRFFSVPVGIQSRNEDGNEGGGSKLKRIVGYAALVENRTLLYAYDDEEYYEEIAAGAFDDVIENDDVRCLFNHDSNMILGRSSNGTLSLSVDEKGLKYGYVTPNRSYAIDLQDAIESGDVSESSFAFRIQDSEWSKIDENKYLRRITKFKRVYDVSPVTYPAYPDTSVVQRSIDGVRESFGENKNKRNLDIYEAQLIVNKNRL